MSKLNITFCSFPDFSGNAKALYEYMVKTYKDKMNYTWIVYSEDMVIKLKEMSISAIVIGSQEFDEYIPNTNVFFTTHANLAGDKFKCKNAIYVELWHGISPKKVGYMMNNISEKDKNWYRSLSYLLDYVIVPSPFWQSIYANRFYLNINQILPIAYPKLDLIKNNNAINNLNKILDLDVTKYNKILFYTPTFIKGCGRPNESSVGENVINLKKYDENTLIHYLKDKNYLLCIKKHPSEECDFTQNIKQSDHIKIIENESLVNNSMDIYDILDAADLLITDFSSLGIEFIFLNKPVIYLKTNEKEYLNNRGIVFEDFSFWTANSSTDNIEDLISLVSKYFDDNKLCESVLEKKKLYFSSLSDGGCHNICDYFFTKTGQLRKLKKVENDSYNFFKSNEQMEYYKKISEEQKKTIDIMVNSRGWKLLEKIRRLLRR